MMTNLKRGIKSNNKRYGWVKRRFSETQRGKIQISSEETNRKKSETWKRKYREGHVNNLKNKPWSERRRQTQIKMKEARENLPKPQKIYKSKEEISKKASKSRKEYFAKNNHHTKETNWFTNGNKNLRLEETARVPDGYRPGRTFLKQRKRRKPTMTIYDE